MLKVISVAASAGLALTVAACGPEGPNRADTGLAVGAIAGGLIGNSVGKGTGRALATVAGAFVGGVVGHEIGRTLDEHDRMLAREAEYEALERGPSGVARTWRNPDNGRYGEVVPSRPYKRAGSDCRDYAHTVYIDGRPQVMRGTACRNSDGSWRSVA
ncbi:MAG: RT0821/Lpp0805 family surface protein [Hyphomicrobiaceae bacterium]